jgi:adenylate cyclase
MAFGEDAPQQQHFGRALRGRCVYNTASLSWPCISSDERAVVDPQAPERRLAAVLAADVAGFSRLMSDDEEGTLRVLTAYRHEMDRLIAAHRGRIVGTAGDSVLAEFASPVEAVRCALETQQVLGQRNAALDQGRRVEFRIGINLGDVMVQGGDLLGDGVNVAARLEGLADPGGICISQTVYDQVSGKLTAAFDDLGNQTVKNMPRPIRAYRLRSADSSHLAAPPQQVRRPRRMIAIVAVTLAFAALAAGSSAWLLRSPATPPQAGTPPLPERPSIAVLAFTNMSDDPRQDYLSDGIAEDLITDLSKISSVFVIARNSSFTYKGKPVNIAQVGRELGVRYVIEGSVRRAGDRMRITAQLIDAVSGHHLWAERYDRDFKEIFELQDEVRQKIVAALAVKLTPVEQQRLARKPTNNPLAYDLWAQGMRYQSHFTREDMPEARRFFERAIELDPNFARAYGQIANTYTIEVELGWVPPSAGSLARALESAQRAATLDDELPEVQWVLSRTYIWLRQYDRALAAIERAVKLDPNFADGRAFYGQVLTYGGRAEEALANIEQAMRTNPHYPFWYLTMLGHAQFMTKHYEAAVAAYKMAMDRNPTWAQSRVYLAATYGMLGQIDDAQWQVAELRTLGYNLRLSEMPYLSFYKDEAYRNLMIEGLRKAGIID